MEEYHQSRLKEMMPTDKEISQRTVEMDSNDVQASKYIIGWIAGVKWLQGKLLNK